MSQDIRADLFDHLEDILAQGWPTGRTSIELNDLGPLMDTARALLMIERGVDPILPKGFPTGQSK